VKLEPVWEVARGVLLKAGRPLHYRYITRLVLESGRTNLTRRGGCTPENSVGTELRKFNSIFRRVGYGIYDLLEIRVRLEACLPSERAAEACAWLANCFGGLARGERDRAPEDLTRWHWLGRDDADLGWLSASPDPQERGRCRVMLRAAVGVDAWRRDLASKIDGYLASLAGRLIGIGPVA